MPDGHSAAPDLSRLAYAVDDALVCPDGDGRELWRVDFGPAGGTGSSRAPTARSPSTAPWCGSTGRTSRTRAARTCCSTSARARTARRPLDTGARDAYDVEPVGGGRRLTTDEDGRPRVHRR
ncbi:hypothetical protein [Saccharothrix xinjiangensis]|uniref:Uncharacterized protein n=1 Tax=Saccharothrix xinjiangensis TaxID=204798 RepID=A0ABV9Y941_9PSEU